MLRQGATANPSPDAKVRMHLADDTALVTIGQSRAMFSARQQKLFALNEGARFWADRVRGGIDADTLHMIFTAQEPHLAAAANLLIRWVFDGIAAVDLDAGALPAYASQTINLADMDFILRYGSRDLADRIGPMFRHVEHAAENISHHYDIIDCGAYVLIARNGHGACIARRAQVAALLKGLITEDVLAGPGSVAAFHAACVIRSGGAMLLLAPPGAGKTVLTTALLDAGLGYGGDDITLVHPSGKVRGVPFLPGAKAGAWRLLAHAGRNREQTIAHQRLDCRRVRYLMLSAPPERDWLPVRWIVSLDRHRSCAAMLTPRTAEDTLAALIREGRSHSGRMSAATLDAMIAIVSNADCHTLTYANADVAAVHCLAALCDNG